MHIFQKTGGSRKTDGSHQAFGFIGIPPNGTWEIDHRAQARNEPEGLVHLWCVQSLPCEVVTPNKHTMVPNPAPIRWLQHDAKAFEAGLCPMKR